jgi:hypothetical protein
MVPSGAIEDGFLSREMMKETLSLPDDPIVVK